MDAKNEKLRNACQSALNTFKKISDPGFTELQSKLEYCIGSFDFDKNPVGLYEYGHKALTALKAYKKDNPRRVSVKTVSDLEKSLV